MAGPTSARHCNGTHTFITIIVNASPYLGTVLISSSLERPCDTPIPRSGPMENVSASPMINSLDRWEMLGVAGTSLSRASAAGSISMSAAPLGEFAILNAKLSIMEDCAFTRSITIGLYIGSIAIRSADVTDLTTSRVLLSDNGATEMAKIIACRMEYTKPD